MNTKSKKITVTLLFSLGLVLAFQIHSLAHNQARPVFFIAGEVTAPGEYEYKEGLTVQQAVVLAKGTTAKAMGKYAMIFREIAGSKEKQEIAVDLDAISKGEKEDVGIQPNDIIIVPNSKMKKINGPGK